MKWRVVVSERIFEDALTDFGARADIHYNPNLYARRDELKALLNEADALIVRNQTRVDDDLVQDASHLEVVGRLGVGLDNLALPVLGARGVRVIWAPGANAVSVAEYVMGAMLELSRRYASISADLHGGRWDREAAIGSELRGKHLGVVGLGDIGSRLARRARAFGMTVVAHDPVMHANSFAAQELDVHLLGLEPLLQSADFVSLHAPLTPGNRHLLNAQTLSLMKPSAYLVNTARGGLVDERALSAALRQGRLAGAALDVRETEPPGPDDPLRGLANVILTPHVAGVTEESDRRVSFHVVQDVMRVLSGAEPLSPAPGSL